MKVAVDEDKCCGAGQCAPLAPETSDQRKDDGIVVLLREEPPEEPRASVREAAQVGPAAVTLTGTA